MAHIEKSFAWQALIQHQREVGEVHMRDLFASDPKRFSRYSLQLADILFDFSKNRITEKTLPLLFDLARQANLAQRIEAMFSGQKINTTEQRAVLHVALRNRSNDPISVDGQDVMPEVNRVLGRMRSFSEAVRSGEWKGFTGKAITDIVNIGIGGSDLGPKMVCEALKPYARPDLHVHFVSNVDSTDLVETLKTIDPETALFLVASKTFTTQETMTNAHSARQWFLAAAKERSCHRQAFCCHVNQHAGGKQIRHRYPQYVRILGLGRRALLAVVGNRPFDSPLPGYAALRRAYGRCTPGGPAFSQRTL